MRLALSVAPSWLSQAPLMPPFDATADVTADATVQLLFSGASSVFSVHLLGYSVLSFFLRLRKLN